MARSRFATTALALALAGCSERGAGPSLSESAQRGRAVYAGVCIACHNPDPRQDGALGPAVAGASRELLEARVLHAKYPPGYTPKRTTQAMPAMPHLGGKIDDLAAFLAECCQELTTSATR
jgi:mono/diheme cytochrome c family protein